MDNGRNGKNRIEGLVMAEPKTKCPECGDTRAPSITGEGNLQCLACRHIYPIPGTEKPKTPSEKFVDLMGKLIAASIFAFLLAIAIGAAAAIGTLVFTVVYHFLGG